MIKRWNDLIENRKVLNLNQSWKTNGEAWIFIAEKYFNAIENTDQLLKVIKCLQEFLQ